MRVSTASFFASTTAMLSASLLQRQLCLWLWLRERMAACACCWSDLAAQYVRMRVRRAVLRQPPVCIPRTACWFSNALPAARVTDWPALPCPPSFEASGTAAPHPPNCPFGRQDQEGEGEGNTEGAVSRGDERDIDSPLWFARRLPGPRCGGGCCLPISLSDLRQGRRAAAAAAGRTEAPAERHRQTERSEEGDWTVSTQPSVHVRGWAPVFFSLPQLVGSVSSAAFRLPALPPEPDPLFPLSLFLCWIARCSSC
jgi:hypothetical protein